MASYQRLKHEIWFQDEEGGQGQTRVRRQKLLFFPVKRKLQRVKIPSLRRLLTKKARLVTAAWIKVCKRLKESQSHFGDLFAGNYLFMQVTPTPNYYIKKVGFVKGGHGNHCSSSCTTLPRIA